MPFLDDGRVELDTNTHRAGDPADCPRPQERPVRWLGRRRARLGDRGLLGGDRQAERGEPFAYLRDILKRLSNGHPISRLDELLPWNWTPSNTAV